MPTDAKQIISVDASGIVTFNVPQTTKTVPIADLQANVDKLQQIYSNDAADLAELAANLSNAQAVLSAAQKAQPVLANP